VHSYFEPGNTNALPGKWFPGGLVLNYGKAVLFSDGGKPRCFQITVKTALFHYRGYPLCLFVI
jgi:hypothetical protein